MKITIRQKLIGSEQRPLHWSSFFAALVLVFAILVLLGWFGEIDFFKRMFPGLVAMNPVTAVCFVLSALSFFMLADDDKAGWKQRVGYALASIVLATGILKLGSILLGIDTHIDSWLFYSKLERDIIGNISNRMASNTALGFVFTAIALLLLNKQISKNRVPSQYLALFIAALSMISVLGYLYNVQAFYGLKSYMPMAVHTAICFLLMALALLTVYPGKGFMSEFSGTLVGAVTARKLIPAAVIVPVVLGFFRLYALWKGLLPEELIVTLMILGNIIIFLVLIWFNARELNIKDALRKKAEEHLLQATNRLALATHAGGVGIWDWDIVNNKLKWDDQMYRLYGITPEKFSGAYEAWVQGLHPEDVERSNDEIQAAIYGGKEFNTGFHIIWPDSSIHYIRGIAEVEYDAGGKALRMIGTNWDITESKQAEKNLQKSLKEVSDYKYALDESSIVSITNQKGIIKYVNDNFCNISKYNSEELIGQDHRIISSGYHSKEFIRDLWVTITNGKIWRGEVKNKAKDGTFYWLDTTIVPFLNEEGKPYQYIALRSDITDRKKAEDQLLRVNRELEAFTYSVSHDLRAPLRGIIGFTSILEEDYTSKLDDEAKRITSIIKTNTAKMGNLIDDLLAFSRLGRQAISKTVIHTNEMVKEMIDEPVLQNMGGSIEWVIHPLPDSIGDINLMRQVWINLISNAVKYSRNKEQPHIEIGSFTRDGQTVFFVKDNGAGFDEQYRDKLFKVFQRLHSADEFEGSGVGLAIVEKIISKHGGKVWAEGEVNKGANFYFSLPDE